MAIDTIDDMRRLFDGIPLVGGLDLDDHQRHRRHPVAHVSARGRGTGGPARAHPGDRSERHPQGVRRPRAPTSIRRNRRCASSPTCLPTPAAELPAFNTISISGYHIREAGSTAAQEIAFTIANGLAYVRAAVAAGLDIDAFAPRLSFFWNSHNHFFEEIAKFRAARRLWADLMRNRLGARRSTLLGDAFPYPNGRFDSHRPAARQQRRPDDGPGDGGGAGRDAVAAHQRLRRGPGPSDRGLGPPRSANPTNPGVRVGHDRHGRSAGRLVLHRGAHR